MKLMTFPLQDRRRVRFAAATAVAVVALVLLAAKEFVASAYASRPDLPSLQKAVLLSPGNADYRHRLGRYYSFVSAEPQAAIASLETSVALNPYDAHAWLDLAGAHQVTGDLTGQRSALEHALAVEPTAPEVAWESANFFLIGNETGRALREFRVVIESDNGMKDAALKACWRVLPDTDALLRDVVPPRTDTLLSFLDLLEARQETGGAIKTWDRIAQIHEKFDNRFLFDFVRYLINERRPDAAMEAWEKTADTLGLSAYLPSDANLVINGDFSLDILNGGFDWTYVTRTGVKPLLDLSDFRQGHRSLSLTFEGPGINDAGFQQLIPVRGAASYNFAAYYKSATFQGAGGPQIVLRDAYTGTTLYASDPLTDSDFWKEVHSQITTPSTTTLLVLGIERFPAGSPIRGKLWLDDFELSPQAARDENAPGHPSPSTQDTP